MNQNTFYMLIAVAGIVLVLIATHWVCCEIEEARAIKHAQKEH